MQNKRYTDVFRNRYAFPCDFGINHKITRFTFPLPWRYSSGIETPTAAENECPRQEALRMAKAARIHTTQKTLKSTPKKQVGFWKRLGTDIRTNWMVYLIALPALLYFFVYCYMPMGGLVIAFKDYKIAGSLWDAPWVGFKHFTEFFQSYYFGRLLKNTLLLSLETLVFGFPIPIIFALLLNEIRNVHFKKIAQSITYIPHFISIIVICGLILDFTSVDGLINTIIKFFGGTPISFLSKPEWFRPVYIISDIWQTFGWNSIVFMAALTGIDMEQYEAARLDGASRLQQILHISLPGITPTIVTLLIMRLGAVMSMGFEKVFNLYNPATYQTADIISTFVYRQGILGANYSSSAAIGLFNSLVNLVLVVAANKISRRLSETSLW